MVPNVADALAALREFELEDLGDAHYRREGIKILEQLYIERFMLGVSIAVFTTRWHLATTAILYRLGARVHICGSYTTERAATGWAQP
jgi:hypothetical protein